MRAFNFKSLVAATLAAASLASVPALAEGNLVDGWPGPLRLAQGGPDRGTGNGSTPSLGVQYMPSSDIVLHGGLDRGAPDILGDRPNIAQYRFGLRIPF